jgi:prepilin-type N-terminal cleavage/methylation domain-containing protein
MKRSGLSLAEVLITLAILGILAAFLIPKVLTAADDKQRKAITSQSVNSITQVVQKGALEGEITPINFTDSIFSNLKAGKRCRTNAQTQGCWTLATGSGLTPELSTLPGLVMPEGSVAIGLGYTGAPARTQPWQREFLVDWNGARVPNIIGQDQLVVTLCYGKLTCNSTNTNRTACPIDSDGKPTELSCIPPGGFGPALLSGTLDTANRTMFTAVMENKK